MGLLERNVIRKGNSFMEIKLVSLFGKVLTTVITQKSF